MCLVSHYSQHLVPFLISLSGSRTSPVRHLPQHPVLCNALTPAGDAIIRIFRKGLVHGPIEVESQGVGKDIFTVLDDVATERGDFGCVVEWYPTLRSQGIYAAMDGKGAVAGRGALGHRQPGG